MRPLFALLRALAIVVVTLTACSSQAVVEQVAPVDDVDAGSVGEEPDTGVALEATPSEDGGESEEPATEAQAIPAGWVGVPGRGESPPVSEFVAMIDTLSDAAALQTTFTMVATDYGLSRSFTEVRESNGDEPGGTYTDDRVGTKVLAGDLVWTEDEDRRNLYVGQEARERDERFTNDHLLKNIRNSIVEAVGYEQGSDGSARWYLLADPTEFVDAFDDWKPTGTVFDLVLTVANVDASGALSSMEMDLAAAGYVRYKDESFRSQPVALQFAFEVFDSRLPLGPPCDAPVSATDDRSREVFHCPIDSEGFVAPHVSVGYLDDPAVASQAYLVANILSTIGYAVDVVPLTEGVEAAYDELAANNIDLYASGWFPADEGQLTRVRAEVGSLGDVVARFDDPLSPGASISSLVVTTQWAEAANIASIDDINADAALYGALDSDGNGKGEIEGCPIGNPCRPWLEGQIASVWTNLELTNRSHDAAFDDLFLAKILGDPALTVAALPNARFDNYFGEWSVVSVQAGIVGVGEDAFDATCEEASSVCWPDPECRAVVEPCLPVFAQADLEVVASAEWVAANPVGAALVEQITVDAEWLHTVADDASAEDSETGLSRVNTYGADDAADGWMSSREALIDQWIGTALAVDPSFATEINDEAEEIETALSAESGPIGVPIERPPRRDGDLAAWEQAVVNSVQNSGALERGDSTELLSLGAGAVCDAEVDAEAMMQLFDAARGRFVDLDEQIGPFLDLMEACALRPSGELLRIFTSAADAELPDGVEDWDGFIAHVQRSGVAWGSIDDVEVMAAHSCVGGYPRLAEHANGYWIGDGMLSISQMKSLASLLDAGCLLGSDTQWRALVLSDTGRDELRRVFGQDAIDTIADAEFECMVTTAAALGRPPMPIDVVAAMAPVCAPDMVIEADTVRYTSDVVPAAAARCVAEGLVGLASSTRDPSMYFGRWLSPALSGQQTLVSQIVRDDCGLTDAQAQDLGIWL